MAHSVKDDRIPVVGDYMQEQIAIKDAMLAIDTCTRWSVEVSPTTAELFFSVAPTYNRMKNMDTLIADLNAVLPTFPALFDLTKSFPRHNFAIGNEYSRVVYIIPQDVTCNLELYFEKVKKVAKKHGADEISLEMHYSQAKIRLWWD